ncbi:hypothetical protein [Sphingopyxis sp.]|jgi:hypothetical protein|uniref:hypothetical protein n=1 Tax=Sphingopyxis sp. TaxID=1908224 RepID=UPI003F72A30F
MTPEIRDSNFLRLKLSRSDNARQPVSFLVGAPFSFDRGVGVPNVDGFLDVVRERVAQSGTQFSAGLEKALSDGPGPLRYQGAMGFVYDGLDAGAAADVVRAAVLRARKPGLPDLDPVTDYDGSPGEWDIARAQRGLARAMQVDPDRFPGPVFTTNFDPLIELALRDRGFVRGEIGIAAAEAAMAAMPQWSSTINARARALRLADYPQDACDLLRGQFRNIKTTVDWQQNLRAYLHEWATCEGKVGGRARRLSNAWLDAISLSDALPVELAPDQVKLSCGGLAVAFERLSDGTPSGVYARARRAVTELGLQANPDSRAATIFARHQQEADALGIAKPADNDQALAWLAEAATAAWQELDDTFLRSLRQDGRLTFQKLRAALSTT